MVGITSYGAYIPWYRLPRELIGKAWGGAVGPGERAVANVDEDSISMAVAAAIDCLKGIDPETVDGLFFASTTSPYKEKDVATLVATAADLRRDIITADFANSLRAGTIALRAALDTVKAGSAKSVVVTVADCRQGMPNSADELNFGDGAAALLVGDTDAAVSLEGSYSIADELMDVWRADDDRFVNAWEPGFVRDAGYSRVLPEAVSGLMKKHNLAPKDFAKVAFYGPDARNHATMARSLGFDPKTQVQDALLTTVGNTGAASPLMILVGALEEAKPGDRILLASYGNGSDALILHVEREIKKIGERRGVKGHLALKAPIPSYLKFMQFRNLVEIPPARRPAETSTPVALYRDVAKVYRLHGCKCKRCGRVQIPIQRVCVNCQAKDEYEEIKLADKKAKIFTFSKDFLATSDDPPNVITMVDFEIGGRAMFTLTDRDPEEVQVDMPVEMTFRKMKDAAGYPNYFWKTKPIR